jgi:hypothetical protein
MSRQITSRTTLENLKGEAKRWLKALRSKIAGARERFERALPGSPANPTLRDVQHALAREHGVPGWAALKDRLAGEPPMRHYEKVAHALVAAYASPDEPSLRIVWEYFGHGRAWDGMRRYIRLDLGKSEQPQPGEADVLTLAEAQYLVARAQGFAGWAALERFADTMPRGKPTIAIKPVAMYASDARAGAPPAVSSRDWDEVIALMQEKRLTGLHAHGQMSDALLERVSRLEHLTSLDLEGSKLLTDDGVHYLSRIPGLRHLSLAGCSLTDRGLEVLRGLTALETIGLAWTHITDAGAAHLAACDRLRSVDLSGTLSGDGAIRALAGKAALADFRTGSAVTDAGLALLDELPVFKSWQGGEDWMALLSPEARPNYLMLRGSFTDRGLAHLANLDGLFALNVDNGQLAITGAGLAPLTRLPHLSWLAFDAKDDSMSFIAALPHLRFLLCQDTTAGDDGFVALSRSQTIEHIWGRRCYNLKRRGFTALSRMPALRHLSVSCKNVDDEGLSALPAFPALKELMPMDVPDEGYRHIARTRVESLVLMYCRETTDAATGHIAGLSTLRTYFASYNRITDRTPEILSGMPSLEEITFDSCAGLTNEGIRHLARLPRLRRVSVGGMPRVTRDVAAAFPPGVRVEGYWMD